MEALYAGDDALVTSPRRSVVLSPRLMPCCGPLDAERWWKRALFGLLALAIMAGYFLFLLAYWAPADPGLNQNGYLVGGKMLALHGTMGVKSADPFQFVGWMWNIVTPLNGSPPSGEQWFYPKYPIGVPALYALLLKINWQQGKVWTFYVSPVTATLAVGAMFMLIRMMAGSFMALMGMLILACSQVLLQFADAPLSHAPALCAVTWGIFFLTRWWQTASVWRGILAGLFLGYAVTTRYTEGLLVLPVAVATLSMIRYNRSRMRGGSLLVLAIAALAAMVFTLMGKYPTERLHTPRWTVPAIIVLVFGIIPLVRGRFYREFGKNNHRRWVAIAIHLLLVAIGAAAIYAIAFRRQPHPWDERLTPVLLLALLVGFIPTLRLDFSLANFGSHVGRFMALAAHWVRIAIAVVLVYLIAFVAKPAQPWDDRVAGIVGVTIFKLCLGGALTLLFVMPWTELKRWRFAIWPTLAWMVPVAALVSFNKIGMHSWTGYDTTHESTAFTWKMFTQKWDETAQQLHDYSMFLIPSLAIVGLGMMYRANWRFALTMTLWFVPGLLLYTSYYFGEDRPGMWYLRFFLTIFPPMLVGAMWLLKSAMDGAASYSSLRTWGEVGRGVLPVGQNSAELPTLPLSQSLPAYRERGRSGSIAGPIAVGILTFCSCAVGLRVAIPPMERELAANWNLAFTCREITHAIPTVPRLKGALANDPLVFADTKSMGHVYPLDNMLSFAGDYDLYPADGFSSYGFGYPGHNDPDAPTPLQPARATFLSEVFRGKSEAEMVKEQNRIMRDALTHDRRAYAVLMGSSGVTLFKKFITDDFEWKQIAAWNEPLHVSLEKAMGPLDPIARGMPLYFTRMAQSWLIYEIKLKPKLAAAQAGTAEASSSAKLPTPEVENAATAKLGGATVVSQTTVIVPLPPKVNVSADRITVGPLTLSPVPSTAPTTAESNDKSWATIAISVSSTTQPATAPSTRPTTSPDR